MALLRRTEDKTVQNETVGTVLTIKFEENEQHKFMHMLTPENRQKLVGKIIMELVAGQNDKQTYNDIKNESESRTDFDVGRLNEP